MSNTDGIGCPCRASESILLHVDVRSCHILNEEPTCLISKQKNPRNSGEVGSLFYDTSTEVLCFYQHDLQDDFVRYYADYREEIVSHSKSLM